MQRRYRPVRRSGVCPGGPWGYLAALLAGVLLAVTYPVGLMLLGLGLVAWLLLQRRCR